MPDYWKAKIYKIVNDVNDDIYIGSTTRSLKIRMSSHIKDCLDKESTSENRKLFKAFREFGRDSFNIVLIENYECESRLELRQKEQEYIDLLKPFYNHIPAFITEEQRRQYQTNRYRTNEIHRQRLLKRAKERRDNNPLIKAAIAQRSKLWYEEHKEELKESYKEKYTCECGDTLTKCNKLRHEKSERHKSILLDPEGCKEKMDKLHNKSFDCECGSEVIIRGKSRHLKSKKHMDYELSLKQEEDNDNQEE
jgi:group I intron endonuclease